MIGAMSPEHALRYFQLTPNKVVIVGGDRAEIILTALDTPTVAVVLTGNFVPSAAVLERAEERGVPLISVESDTVTAADDLRRLFGRLRVKERAKIDLIAELIDEVGRSGPAGGRPAGMTASGARAYVITARGHRRLERRRRRAAWCASWSTRPAGTTRPARSSRARCRPPAPRPTSSSSATSPW